MQVSTEVLVLGGGIAKYSDEKTIVPSVVPVVVDNNKRYLLLSEFKKVFIKNYSYNNVVDEKKNAVYFDKYIKLNTPFQEYLVKNPGLMGKIVISASFCYYSTPELLHLDFKTILDYFIKDYSGLEILDYSSHIGFDTMFFTKLFKKVYVNDIDDLYLKLLKINFTTFGIKNYEICRNVATLYNGVDVVYFDPPFAGWDQKVGDYFYGDKKLQDIITEFSGAKMIIIKHHKDLPYVDYTFNFIKHYNKKFAVDPTKIFCKFSVMKAKPVVDKMKHDFLVGYPSYGSGIRKILEKNGFNTN
jgi:16S rRNA G966 N2-methylase RsmD